MKYYGYTRVSTQSQVEHGQGLDTQKNAIIKYANDNNLQIEQIFTDAGISGTCPDREGLNDLFSVLEPDDCIIVLNTSRLWRSDSVKVLVHHELKKDHISIKSIEQPNYDIYTKDPNDFLFNGMMELLDQYERLTISKKLAKGRKTKATKGVKACGTAPYGYKWDNAQIVIDYNNNLVVKDIFQMYSENKNYSTTAKMCAEKGYKTSTGKDFSVQAIKNIIHNDFYCGIVTHAGVKTQGTHEPIISTEIFSSVQ